MTEHVDLPSIPEFRPDGYLPEGTHLCSAAEALFRFGAGNSQRRRLALRLRHWLELGRVVGVRRVLIDGSFVTAKELPQDVDAVMLVPADFQDQVNRGIDAALELDEIFRTRQPQDLFAAMTDDDWNGWVAFFSRTREPDRRRKGLVEICQ